MNPADNPRDTVLFLLMVLLFFYQSVAALLAILLYYMLVKPLHLDWKMLAGVGLLSVCAAISLLYYHYPALSLKQMVLNGLTTNGDFYKIVFHFGYQAGFNFLLLADRYYLGGLPLFFIAIFTLIETIPLTAHEHLIKSLTHAKSDNKKEISSHILQKKLRGLHEDNYAGTLLGLSKWSGKPIIVPDYYLNQMMLVLGTTGAGKTVTLRRFYQRAIKQGWPVIILDGKPTEESVQCIKQAATESKRPFFGFGCDTFRHYDPLAQGGHTELKDKMMTLKDKWENDYYKSIAEDYLQTVFEVLLWQNQLFDLRKVVDCLDIDELISVVRASGDKLLQQRVKRIATYERKDIAGLQAHLNVLLNSEMGEYFKRDDSTFSLQEVINSHGVVYFALPALRYPEYAKLLGKLVVNDIKTVIDRADGTKPLYLSFDEFSVFAGEQVLNIVNMGRGKGVHATFGTQGVSDLKLISTEFSDQLLNCCNSIICHRVNDNLSIEAITSWAGTNDIFTVTAQVDVKNGGMSNGSVRRTKEFVIHPDEIKQALLTGEAFYMTKMSKFCVDKIKILLNDKKKLFT